MPGKREQNSRDRSFKNLSPILVFMDIRTCEHSEVSRMWSFLTSFAQHYPLFTSWPLGSLGIDCPSAHKHSLLFKNSVFYLMRYLQLPEWLVYYKDRLIKISCRPLKAQQVQKVFTQKVSFNPQDEPSGFRDSHAGHPLQEVRWLAAVPMQTRSIGFWCQCPSKFPAYPTVLKGQPPGRSLTTHC